MTCKPATLLLGAALACAAPTALAVAIDVLNPSFENPNETTFGSAPDSWVRSSTSDGLFDPVSNDGGLAQARNLRGIDFIDGILGSQTAYSNSGNFSQGLAAVLDVGTYTLTVAVGDRKDLSLPAHRINLLAGPSLAGASVVATAAGAAAAGFAEGSWMDLIASATVLDGDSLLSEGLWIELVNVDRSAQINWDDVRLEFESDSLSEATAMPEPAPIALLGLGLVLLARYRRRQPNSGPEMT